MGDRMPRRWTWLVGALVLASGCGREGQGPDAETAYRNASRTERQALPTGSLAPADSRTSRITVGRLPDHGELLAYGNGAPRRGGGRTWHPAAISEEHAIRSIDSGVLRVRTPAGQVLEYEYEDHHEIETGEWS